MPALTFAVAILVLLWPWSGAAASAQSQFGTGADGPIFVGSGATKNINTDIMIAGRTAPDAPNWVVVGLSSNTAGLNPAPNGLAPGDEVLLINLQGSSAYNSNVGNWEFLKVASIAGAIVTFTTNIQKIYGNSASNADLGAQHIVLQRVPNYSSVTANGTLTCSAWNGQQGGVLAFRCKETLTVGSSGSISADGKGHRGGTPSGGVGEWIDGFVNAAAGRDYGTTAAAPAGNRSGGGGGGTGGPGTYTRGGGAGGGGYGGGGGGGGGGGHGSGNNGAGGVGGGMNVYAGGGGGGSGSNTSAALNGGAGGAAGAQGSGGEGSGPGSSGAAGNGATTGQGGGAGTGGYGTGDEYTWYTYYAGGGGGGGGGTYGIPDLRTKLYLGAGGGAGGYSINYSGSAGGSGGAAGGIILIYGQTVDNGYGGSITAGGAGGGSALGAGGGGSGGSILVSALAVLAGTGAIQAPGAPANGSGAGGGVGRIALEYVTLTGTTNPAHVQVQTNAGSTPLVEGAASVPALTDTSPEFMAVYNAGTDGSADAMWIEVAASSDASYAAPLWSSGWLPMTLPDSSLSSPQVYAGSPLQWAQGYIWRARFRSANGIIGSWTGNGSFTMVKPTTILPLNGWSMICLPRGDAAPVASALGDDIPGIVAYAWDEPSSSYVTASTMEPGRGHMINSIVATVDLDSGQALYGAFNVPASNLSFTSPAKGYNIIGNPFNSPINWQTGSTLAGAQTTYWWWDGTAYRWYNKADDSNSGNWGTDAPQIIPPWRAFWVRVIAAGPSIQLTDPTGSSEPGGGPPNDENQWRLQIAATQGALQDASNFFGAYTDAQDAYDSYDVGDMGSLSYPYVNLFADHADWPVAPGRYTQDMGKTRFNAGESITWTLVAEANLTGPITLTWPNLADLAPAAGQWKWALADPDSGTVTDLETAGSYTYAHTGGVERTLILTATRTSTWAGTLFQSVGPNPPAAASVPADAQSVVMAQLKLNAGLETLNVSGLSIGAQGTAHDAQAVAAVRIVHDLNGSGTVDLGEPVLAGPSLFSADDGTISWSALSLAVEPGVPQVLLVVYDLSGVAQPGQTLAAGVLVSGWQGAGALSGNPLAAQGPDVWGPTMSVPGLPVTAPIPEGPAVVPVTEIAAPPPPAQDAPPSGLQALIDAATTGDTVTIPAGTHEGSLVVPPGVSLIGAGADATFLVGSAGAPAILVEPGSDVATRVSDLNVSGAGCGIETSGAVRVELRHLVIHGTAGDGIRAQADTVLVVDHVTAIGNSGDGIHSESPDTTVVNSILAQNGGAGVSVPAEARVEYNLSWGNLQRDWSAAFGGAGNNSEEPLWADEAPNYYEASASPAVNAGAPPGHEFGDFRAEPEPNGGRTNLGAHGNTARAAPSPVAPAVEAPPDEPTASAPVVHRRKPNPLRCGATERESAAAILALSALVVALAGVNLRLPLRGSP